MNFGRINALLLKYWYITKNRWDRLFDLFYWPLIDLLVWVLQQYILDSSLKLIY